MIAICKTRTEKSKSKSKSQSHEGFGPKTVGIYPGMERTGGERMRVFTLSTGMNGKSVSQSAGRTATVRHTNLREGSDPDFQKQNLAVNLVCNQPIFLPVHLSRFCLARHFPRSSCCTLRQNIPDGIKSRLAVCRSIHGSRCDGGNNHAIKSMPSEILPDAAVAATAKMVTHGQLGWLPTYSVQSTESIGGFLQ